MQRREVFGVVVPLAIAGSGAGLALLGAAATGNLGAATTIERIEATPAGPPVGASPVRRSRALSAQQIYTLDAPGVVQITATKHVLGSGFVIDKTGHVVTNTRVITDEEKVQVSFSGNDRIDARVVGRDPSTGVAVLQVDAHSRSLTPLPLGDSDGVQVGDAVVAIGNPQSLTRTASAGIVSAVQRTIDAPDSASRIGHAIQTDAAINSSNSGGPLIDARGEVIGINAQIQAGAAGPGGTAGLGSAIPINTAKAVVAQLIRSGVVQHAFLGATAVPVTGALARTFNLPTARGLIVQRVTPGSGADQAGLSPGQASTRVVVAGESYRLGGDIIVAADGIPVSGEEGLRDVLEQMRPGDRLALEIWRAGRRKTVRVTLGKAPG